MKRSVCLALLLMLLLSACASPAPSQTPAPTRTPVARAAPVMKEAQHTPEPTPTPQATPAGSRYLPPTPSPVPLNPLGLDIADYALEFYGCDYRYGGRDPETGFDCSGLVWYVYDHFGIPLNRTAADQAKNGVPVPPAEAAPGDIILFYRGNWIGHAGICLGYGEYIHAMDVGIGVVISPLSEVRTKFELRRVFAEEEGRRTWR